MSIQAAIDAEPSFSMGRYTLKEAAQAIAKGTGENKELLEEKIKKAFADRLIPIGGTSMLREQLCSSHPQLFNKVTFDDAWKVARKENVVKMENNEQYINPK